MDGGLEAHYALLREVSARGHAVQSRLRASLPLLWTDTALVMNGAARRGYADGTRNPRREARPSVSTRKDAELAGNEEMAREWSSAGRRRRMEWEVSRRIARVDRELQTKPRGRRYWHKASADVVPLPGSKNAVQSAPRVKLVSSVVQTEAELLSSRRPPRSKPRGQETVATGGEHYMTPTASWKASTSASNAIDQLPVKRDAATSKPKRVVDNDVDAFRNIVEPPAAKRPDSPTSKAAEASNPTLDQPTDSRNDRLAPPLPDPLPNEFVSEESSASTKLTAEEPLHLSPNASTSDDASRQLSSPRRSGKGGGSQPIEATMVHSSSIGRQVLSDYRTMPSVASFGPGLTATSGRGRGHVPAKLNADVLRRLFNNLDSDRDGHINRIEVCLALHRLQIAVPAASIASFFRNVYTASGSDKTSNRPLHEVINYKQFAAFVTAAFDKRRQAAEADAAARRAAATGQDPTKRQEKTRAADRQSLFPSTEVPMLQKRPSASTNAHTKAGAYPVSAPPTQEPVWYQVEDVEPAVTQSIELTNRIVSEMPDVLVSRLLADAVREAQVSAAAGRSDAKALVRKSLEGLPATDDDKITTQIVQELVKEHLRTHLDGGCDESSSEDLTGLMRAAAFFELQSEMNVEESGQSVEDANPDQSMDNWLDIVTEEQVSALIHEVWRENDDNTMTCLSPDVEVDTSEKESDNVESTGSSVELDANVLQSSSERINTLAEKAVQAVIAEDGAPSSPTPDIQMGNTLGTRTHLGRLVRTLVPSDQMPPTTVSDALRLLRRKRLEQQSKRRLRLLSRSSDKAEPNEQSGGAEYQGVAKPASVRSWISCDAKSSSSSSIGSTHDKENEGHPNVPEEAPQHDINPEPLDSDSDLEKSPGQPLREFDLPLRGSWSSGNARSSSSSCNVVSAGSLHSSSPEGSVIFNAVDRRVRSINLQHHVKQARQRGYWTNADLSEGEIDPGSASEGEITGRRREAHVKVVNSANRRRLQRPNIHQSSSEGIYSSAESGELLSRVISSVSSSRESGELIKVRSLLPYRHPEDAT